MKLLRSAAMVLLVLSTPVIPSELSLYQVSYHQLDNGMGVILKQRGDSRNVSIRLGVDVGLEDFSCEKREVPHFLEHLLFTGTSKNGEYELERMLNDRGGFSNASTGRFRTTYETDIHSDYVMYAVGYLYEIMTDSLISEEDVEKSRNIIFRERGGERSELIEFLHEKGLKKSAYSKLAGYINMGCDTLTSPKGVTREDIMRALESFYVPNNMVISIVGMFSEEKVLKTLNSTFGQLYRVEVDHSTRRTANLKVDGPREFVGSLSPILATDATVDILYMVPNRRSSEKYPLQLLESYLQDRIFKKVRIDNGLGYSPDVSFMPLDDIGLFGLSGDVDFDEMKQVQELLQQEIDAISQGDIDEEIFNKTKQYLSLSYDQGYELNASYADYYVSRHYELQNFGILTNESEAIERVMLAQFSNIAQKYLRPENQLIARDYPTLSYHQLFVGIGVLILIAMIIMARYLMRRRRI